MEFESSSNRFKKYLDKIKDDDEKRCFFCNKTPDDIRAEYYQYMMDPDAEFDDVPLDELIIMTDKLKKPVCAGCYFNIKDNPELIEEIFNRPEDEVW